MKNLWRIHLIITLCLFTNFAMQAQSYDAERTAFTNFLIRMYNNTPFEGVRIIEDYEEAYLLSVLTLEKSKYPNESTMNRVASVKAMSQVSRFFNGSNITSDIIIRTSEKSDGSSDTEIIENITENSVGYVKQFELLTNFPAKNDKKQVYIFYKKLDIDVKKGKTQLKSEES